MTKLTKISGDEFVLNADIIKFLEETPDTVITLLSNEKIIVKESLDEIIRRVIVYSRAVRAFPPA